MKFQDLATTNSKPLFSRKQGEKIERDALFSHGPSAFAVVAEKRQYGTFTELFYKMFR